MLARAFFMIIVFLSIRFDNSLYTDRSIIHAAIWTGFRLWHYLSRYIFEQMPTASMLPIHRRYQQLNLAACSYGPSRGAALTPYDNRICPRNRGCLITLLLVN